MHLISFTGLQEGDAVFLLLWEKKLRLNVPYDMVIILRLVNDSEDLDLDP